MAVKVEAPRGSAAFMAGAPVKLHERDSYYDAENTPNRGRTYDVSPDGTRFLRVKQDASQASATRGSLVVVVNWFEELKRLALTK